MRKEESIPVDHTVICHENASVILEDENGCQYAYPCESPELYPVGSALSPSEFARAKRISQ